MDYRALFADVYRRPTSYGLDGTFLNAVAFVNGCDAGNSWGLLIGFREWLAMKLNCEANLVWWRQVSMLAGASAYGECEGDVEDVDDVKALEALFNLLDEFLSVRNGPHGAPTIIQRYHETKSKRMIE